MREQYIKIHNLSVAKELSDFVKNELLLDTNVGSDEFWKGFDKVVHELAPKNKKLLEIRETLQQEIDLWHKKNRDHEIDYNKYKNFLEEIGYLKKEGEDFKIATKNLDEEISNIAGPQLVVPIMNSRYSLNAANARWVSLYDSLYGSNIIESEESGSEKYDPLRGQEVIKYTRNFLNKYFPINDLDWKDITGLAVNNKKLSIYKENKEYNLSDLEKFIGHRGDCLLYTSPSPRDS